MGSRARSLIFVKLSPPHLDMHTLQELLQSRIFWLVISFITATANLLFPTSEVFGLTLAGLCLMAALTSPVAMLVVLLVLAPLRTLIATESGIDLPLDIGQILFVVYGGIWVAHQIAQRKPVVTLQRDIVLSSVLSVCVVFALGAWTSASLSAWLREWLKWILMAVFVWHLTLSGQSFWRWLVYALLVAASANALVGLYIFFGGSGALHLAILGRFFRAFGTFGQPNPFAGFMGITLPLAIMGAYVQLSSLLNSYRAKRKIQLKSLLLMFGFGISAVLLSAALLASWSRGAWLGTAVAVAVMLFALPKRLTTGLAAALGLALLIAGLWLGGLLPQSVVNRLTTSVGDFFTVDDIRGVDISPFNYAVVERIAHWQAALNMAQANPILGVGLGNYEIAYDQYRLINWEEPLGHAHNFYLNVLAETGVVGLATYLLFWIVVFVVTWQMRGHPDPFARATAIALLGSWTYLSVHSIFDNLIVNNLFLHIGVLLGMLAILYQQLNHKVILD